MPEQGKAQTEPQNLAPQNLAPQNLAPQVNPNLLVEFQPEDIPGLVAFWRFSDGGSSDGRFVAAQGQSYELVSSTPMAVTDAADAPLGSQALNIAEGQWLHIPRRDCPLLDIHGRQGHLTVVAWLKRQRTAIPHCEFIAGQWNESGGNRQYGLFLNISVWGENDQICGHLSHVGGPTPGYKYCIDGAMGASAVPYDTWSVVAMSYDGQAGYAWLDGRLDARPGLNPYPLAGGLHDGGAEGSDFTVGAVDRSGEMGNFFCGLLAGLAVYRRALTPAEIFALAQL
jgi:hypothetical protein